MGYGKRFIYFADKSIGDSHSFVDGMMLGSIPSDKFDVVVVYFKSLVGLGKKNDRILATPLRRNFFGRLFQGPVSFFLIRKYLIKEKERCVLFVRNEIFVLFFYSLLKKINIYNYDIYFQNSFPHEHGIASDFVRFVYLFVLRFCLRFTDRVFVVNENAVGRIRSLSSKVRVFVIPLCTDFKTRMDRVQPSGVIKFIYVGTYARLRGLDVVIKSFGSVFDFVDFELQMYGGTITDFLDEYPETNEIIHLMMDRGSIKFMGRVSRVEIQEAISRCDVGLNLIPPIEQYFESSSTKIGEYLSQGIPAISSNSIPYHHQIHAHGDIGWMCDFNQDSIRSILLEIISGGRGYIEKKRDGCLGVYKNYLNYDSYKSLITD